MICPECKKAGKKSKVYPSYGMRTAIMGYQPYYDESGQLHQHDPNFTKTSYRCSNGHEWIGNTKPTPCWCGWPKEEEK
jgi:hypothetical protein